MTRQTALGYMQIRGGSSKGVYLHKADLPDDPQTRDAVLKAVMGAGGDARQIDGLGGADPLTSKLAIISRSDIDGVDLDYQFVQAIVGEDRLDDTPNCGNILAGVGAFALEAGLITLSGDEAEITVNMVNSGKRCDLLFPLEDGLPAYEGEEAIDGVYGRAAPVLCLYHELAGSICGGVIPTGYMCDEFDGVKATCVDNGMPAVVMRAEAFGLSGQEPPEELNSNQDLCERLEAIRLQAGQAMGLGDVHDKVIPKLCLVSAPAAGGHLCTRSFIPNSCHPALGVLTAVSVATAALYPRSAIHDLAEIPDGLAKQMRLEHPSGHLDVLLELNPDRPGIDVVRAGIMRTARLISTGEVYIPHSVWAGPSA